MATTEQKPSIFEVISTIERMDIDEKGRFHRIIEVSAKTASGIEFTETFPKAGITKAKVASTLEARAKELEAIRALRK